MAPASLFISALGARVEISFDASVSDEDARRFAEVWEGAAIEPAPADAGVRVSLGTTQVPGSAALDVAAVSFDVAVATLSNRVTLAAIENRKSDLVMIHACAVAAADGTVSAFVGPSGRGKTTLVSRIARHYAYVTDETVGIASDGRVMPYRKPLSRVAPSGTKVQLSPASADLLPLPEAPLTIGSITLIDRQPSWAGPAVVTRVPLIEALPLLVPELSYLPQLDAPLQRLARLVTQVGGVSMISYGEADSVTEALAAIKDSQVVDSWTPIDRREAPPASLHDGQLQRVEAIDGLLIDGRMVLLHGVTVRVLDGIGPAIWNRAAEPVTLDEVVEEIERLFGPPAEGDARAIVEGVVGELVGIGLLRAGPSS